MGRAPCCDKANVKKGPWSPEEDGKLKEYIEKYGTGGNWISLPQKAGLRRCGKSCRLRWLNYLRPNIKHGEFSADEDKIICTLFTNIGSRWSIIAAQLPGRTDNDIKNYWNTKLKKKLMGLMAPKKPHQSSITYPSLLSLLQTPSSSPSSSSTLLQPQDGYVGPMHNYQPSCTSSDGSINYDQYGVFYNGVDANQRIVAPNVGNIGGFCDQKPNGIYGDAPLDYSIEEIKKLISTNYSCNNLNFFDGGTKREEEEEVMFY